MKIHIDTDGIAEMLKVLRYDFVSQATGISQRSLYRRRKGEAFGSIAHMEKLSEMAAAWGFVKDGSGETSPSDGPKEAILL
jgi:hypothetical protein